jgi:hypothetical protein
MKISKRGMALGVLVLGMPMLALAQEASRPVSSVDADPVPAATTGDTLPASRDALFDLDSSGEKRVGQAVKESQLPASKNDLFDLPSEKDPIRSTEGVPPTSKEALFGDLPPEPQKEEKPDSGWHGFFQGELARTYADPEHWSKLVGRLELGSRGRLGNGVQWKVSGRMDYNAIYDLNDFYAAAVRKDQRAEFHLRENYLDFAAGDWEYRLGRQHIVWGEMVGLFVADAVSAKDMREFILPDFQILRIPQWAARAEYFKNDLHAELIWIPFPSYDKIGKPFDPATGRSGSEFYAYPASPGTPIVLNEQKPGYGLGNTNYGMRLSSLTNGWDISGFLYGSRDSAPTFYLVDNPLPGVYRYEPRHERIWQAGGTLAKDMGSFVLKAEAIYTDGRRFNVVDPADLDGVVKQNTLDWIVGLDFNPTDDMRINTQFYQRIYFDHDPNIIPDRVESGFSLLLNHKFPGNVEAEALLVHSLNRSDWMFRPKLNWGFERNWRLLFGLDIFSGPATGIFGQFDDRDRVYTELRYDF